jgi:hypothetical protein
MPSAYEREVLILRAKGLLQGGYETQYIYNVLVSGKLTEADAADIIKNLTGKPFQAPVTPLSTPGQAPVTATTPADKAQPIQKQNKPIEIPAPLSSLVNKPPTSPDEVQAITSSPVDTPQNSPSKVPLPLSTPVDLPKSSSSEEVVSLASLVDTPKTKEASSPGDEPVNPVTLFDASQPDEAENKKLSDEFDSLVAAPQPSQTENKTSTAVSAAQVSSPSAEFRRQEAIRIAAALLNSGYDANYIIQKLVRAGYSRQEAASTVLSLTAKPAQKSAHPTAYAQSYNKLKNDPRSHASQSNTDNSAQVMIGVVMILIGCGITFFSFQAASNNPGGGTYVVTFGLIIAGAFRVIRGLSN